MTDESPLLLRRARRRALSARAPGPDIPPGPRVTAWPGPVAEPGSADGALDPYDVLRRSLAARDPADARLRGVPSAGGLHPVNAHVLAGPGCAVPPGRYAYDPVAHRLTLRAPAPAAVVPPGALVVLTVTARRTVSHYGHRAWPLLLLDTGHAVAGLVLAAGERAPWNGDADAALLAAAAGLPGEGAVWPGGARELPLACVWLGAGERGAGRALASWGRDSVRLPRPGGSGGVDAVRDDLGEAEAVLRLLGGARPGYGGTWTPVRAPAPPRAGRSAAPPLTGVPAEADLVALLAAASSVPSGPRWCVALGGAEPRLVELSAESGELSVLARGDARPTLAVWAARQGWVADCGAVLLAYGCPLDAPPARVRGDHLAAGVGAGLAQAVAEARGLRSRPVGSWQGADLGAALGGPPGRALVLHGLALGAAPAPPAETPYPDTPESDRTP